MLTEVGAGLRQKQREEGPNWLPSGLKETHSLDLSLSLRVCVTRQLESKGHLRIKTQDSNVRHKYFNTKLNLYPQIYLSLNFLQNILTDSIVVYLLLLRYNEDENNTVK